MKRAPSQGFSPVASPVPLVFLAQAVASFSLAAVQLQWISEGEAHTIAWSVLLLTVPLQAIASVIAFVARDVALATGAGLLAGTWAATAGTLLMSPPGSTSRGLGVLLVASGVALLVPASAAVTRLAACVVILVSGARFAATGIYQLTADTTWRTVAGWIGLGLVVIGGYAATAFGLSGSFRTDVLPIGRRDVPTAPRP